MPIYRRVPKRGFTNARFRTEYTIINVDGWTASTTARRSTSRRSFAQGLVSLNTPLLKVLGNGDLKRKLTVRAQQVLEERRGQDRDDAGG